MFGIVADFIQELNNIMAGNVTFEFASLIEQVFRLEKIEAFALAPTFAAVGKIIYGYGIVLITVKFMKKGFMVYIAWRDGDSDVSPFEMLTGGVQAVIIAVCFPVAYDYFVMFLLDFSREILSVMKVEAYTGDFLGQIFANMQNHVLNIIFTFIFLISYLLLYFKLIKRGIELLILRLGVPIAVAGLIDSDGGSWKPYVQMFIKLGLTTIVQVSCLTLALRFCVALTFPTMILALAILGMAHSTPALLEQFMVRPAQSGGGFGQKVYQAGMTASMFKRFVGK